MPEHLISIHCALAAALSRIKHLLNVSCRLKLGRNYLLTFLSLTPRESRPESSTRKLRTGPPEAFYFPNNQAHGDF